MLPGPSWDLPLPELAAVLDWLPLASLLLGADGGALGVSREWSVLSGLAAEDSRGGGWVSAVDVPDRGVLRTRLRDAALAGRAGCADFRLAGRWSRWWWRPGPCGRLIVCVADLGDWPGRDGQWEGGRLPAGLVRCSELVNLAERALRRRGRHGGHVAVLAVRLDGAAGPGGEPGGGLLRAVAERVSAAAGPGGAAAWAASGEFLVLLDGLRAPGDAVVIAGQVRDAVSRLSEAGGAPVRVTAVTAVTVADGAVRGAGELIKKACSAVRPAQDPDVNPAAAR